MEDREKIGIGYGTVPTYIMKMDIPQRVKLLLMCLVCYAGNKDYCFPSITTICKDLGMGRTTVSNALKEAENLNLIKREKLYKDDPFKKNNKYTLMFKLRTIDSPVCGTSDSPSSEHSMFTDRTENINININKNIINKNINNSDSFESQNEEGKNDYIKFVSFFNEKLNSGKPALLDNKSKEIEKAREFFKKYKGDYKTLLKAADFYFTTPAWYNWDDERSKNIDPTKFSIFHFFGVTQYVFKAMQETKIRDGPRKCKCGYELTGTQGFCPECRRKEIEEERVNHEN